MILKDGRFWIGVIVGIVVVSFVPQVNPKNLLGKKSG